MEKYYNETLGKEFASKVSLLKQQLRTQEFNPEKSTFGISGSTFRAFKDCKVPPSKVYQDWAKSTTKRLFESQKIPNLSSQIEFDNWHIGVIDSFKTFWEREQGEERIFAHTYKVVDLYIKWLSSLKECPKQLCDGILKFGYCALDSQILIKLNECLSGALPIRNPSMGDISNRNTYDFCQTLIEGFCVKYGGTRLLFDYFAWKPGGSSQR